MDLFCRSYFAGIYYTRIILFLLPVIPYKAVAEVSKIKGPDNPTSQFLPIMSNIKCYRGEGEGRKDKGGGGASRSKTSCM